MEQVLQDYLPRTKSVSSLMSVAMNPHLFSFQKEVVLKKSLVPSTKSEKSKLKVTAGYFFCCQRECVLDTDFFFSGCDRKWFKCRSTHIPTYT